MNIKKGYIIPVILVILLLISAGFVVFTKKVAESPVLTPPANIATTTDVVEDDGVQEDIATTTDEVDDIQATTSTSTSFEE